MKRGSKGGDRNQKAAGGGAATSGSSKNSASSSGSVPPQLVLAIAKELQIAEVGVEVASFIAQTTEYHLREIIEDAVKVRTQSRRKVLTVDDINFVMRLRGLQPLYGFSGGGAGGEAREVTTSDGKSGLAVLSDLGDKKENLAHAMQTDLPKVPREPSLVLHWLAIDGVQPLVPQNPPPHTAPDIPAPIKAEGGALVVPERTHPLSEELWMYYKRAIKAIMTGTEGEKRPIYASLGGDPGLHELVPYLSLHVHNTVTAAVGSGRGALEPLWAAMKIFRCMVVNPHMHLELYLHQMLPSVMTVIANNRLASGNGSSNGDHYSLRVVSAQTLAMLVRKYANVYRPLASVICKTFAERTEEFIRQESPQKGMIATLYGTIVGIRHLGSRPVEIVLLPVAEQLLHRLEAIVADRTLKLRRRLEAQHCIAALTAAVGEYMGRKQGQPIPFTIAAEAPAYSFEMKGATGGFIGECLLPYVSFCEEHLLSL